MRDGLASVRGIVDLSAQDALDSAQAFLMRQGYQVVQRADTALTVSRRKREGMWGHSLPHLTVSATPQPSGGVRIKFTGNDREGLQERQAAFVEWSEGLPRKPQQETEKPENKRQDPGSEEKPRVVEPAGTKRYCMNCGSELPRESANFCPNCDAAQQPRVQAPTGPPPGIPEMGPIQTPSVPNVPPSPQQENIWWTGTKLFVIGCVVLPVAVLLGLTLLVIFLRLID